MLANSALLHIQLTEPTTPLLNVDLHQLLKKTFVSLDHKCSTKASEEFTPFALSCGGSATLRVIPIILPVGVGYYLNAPPLLCL